MSEQKCDCAVSVAARKYVSASESEEYAGQHPLVTFEAFTSVDAARRTKSRRWSELCHAIAAEKRGVSQ